MDTQNSKKAPWGRYTSAAKTHKRGSSFSSFFCVKRTRNYNSALKNNCAVDVDWTVSFPHQPRGGHGGVFLSTFNARKVSHQTCTRVEKTHFNFRPCVRHRVVVADWTVSFPHHLGGRHGGVFPSMFNVRKVLQ